VGQGDRTISAVEVLALGAIALGVALRLGWLGQRELWYDEVLSLVLSTGHSTGYVPPGSEPVPLATYAALLHAAPHALPQTVKQLLQRMVGTEPHPPLFYLSQHLWLRVWGTGETALRSLNGLLSIGTLALGYGLGTATGGRRLGLMLAALLALNPFLLFHSLNLRMYLPVVFWVVLASWALVETLAPRPSWGWQGVFVGAIAGGLMTSYLLVYWLVGAGLVVLLLDRWRVLWHGLRVALAIGLTLPWMAWGLRQQLGNIDLDRFSEPLTGLRALVHHGSGAASTLGIHLLWGDWGAVLPPAALGIGAVLAVGLLGWAVAYLVRRHEYRRVALGLGLGLVPFAAALGADVVFQKTTLPWGLGRSVIFALPGLLLLLALAMDQLPRRGRTLALAGVLAVYLGLGSGDLVLRQRHSFRTAAAMATNPDAPTLVVLNSTAWGHVLRTAYYMDRAGLADTTDLLATPPAELAPALATLTATDLPYQQVLWLQAERPLWSELESPEQVAAAAAATAAALERQFHPVDQQVVAGTMSLDQFTVQLYQRGPS